MLVSNSTYALDAFGQLYRDRADCENGFDELKNQWGWGGFTTQDIERCQTSARAVALVYNWWSWYLPSSQAGRKDGRHHESSTIARRPPVSVERLSMLGKQRCISRQCTPQKTS